MARIKLAASAVFVMGVSLLLLSGCAHIKQGKPVTLKVDTKKIRAVSNNNAPITCTDLTATLRFLDANNTYAAQSITSSGKQCSIHFDIKDFSTVDTRTRVYTLYLYRDQHCIASIYYAPDSFTPFVSSVC